MQKAIALRYTLTSTEADAALAEWVRATSPCHLLVRHNADQEVRNPHWHAIMYTDRSPQSLRVAMTKAVPSTKNRYSMKQVGETEDDHNKYVRYMCHGDDEETPPVIVSAQGSATHPAGWGTQAWARAQQTEFYSRRREYKQKQKDDGLSMLETCLLAAEQQNITAISAITDLVMEKYQEKRKMMDLRLMENVARSVWYTQNKQEAGDHIKKSLMNRLQFII